MPTKVYERQFLASADSALLLPDGDQVVYASEVWVAGDDPTDGIRWPHQCLITKLVVRLADGDPGTIANFTVDLFNRAIDESTYASLGPISRVVPQQTAVIAGAVSLISDSGYTFHNMQGTITIPDRRIFLRIGVDGVSGEDTLWDVALACIIPD